MRSRLRVGRRKYGLKSFLLREANNGLNRLVFKSGHRALVEAFRSVGICRGMRVCVHASLSQLGYVEGGAHAVVDALLESVGPDGCLVMPAFSMSGTMKQHLERKQVFDVRATPSSVGAVAEAFRTRNGVIRSLHPTNSVIATGPGAEELLRGHEDSPTPYGHATPYGRLTEDENAYILMINTHVQSLLHHIQERVAFPNLFLDEMASSECVDAEGKSRIVQTRVMRPKVPYYVAIPAKRGPAPEWAMLHDFALIFPTSRQHTVAKLGYRFDGHRTLLARRQQLIDLGILRSRKLGRGEIGLLSAARFVRFIQPEFEQSIGKYRQYYDIDYIQSVMPTFG